MGMYSYDDEIKKLQQKIKASATQSAVSKNMKLLEQLKRALEMADGPERIFAKHMPKKDGKYIVFCSGLEHLNEMVDMSSKWFMMVDKKPNIYRAYYNDPENSNYCNKNNIVHFIFSVYDSLSECVKLLA